jgi:hypothetical protein
MTREQKIQWLVANRKEWSGEEGSEILNAFSETRLDTIIENAQVNAYYEAVANAAANGFTDGKKHYRYDPDNDQFVFNMTTEGCNSKTAYTDEEDEEEEEVPKPKMVGNSAPMTLNEMYERGDSQVKSMIDTWKEADTRERQQALTTLTANTRSDEAKKVALATLNRHTTQDLKALAQAMGSHEEAPAPSRPNYYGAGGPPPQTPTQNAADRADVLPLPVSTYGDVASPRLLERIGRNGN